MRLRAVPLQIVIWAWLLPALASASVTEYHNNPARDGNFTAPGLSWQTVSSVHVDSDFHGTVNGAVYAQPLYWHPPGAARGLLIVATEANEVDALDADTGRTVWRKLLGKPVPLARLPCGNIDPLGITGTPVIDASNGTIYLDAIVEQNGTPQHLVFGLRLSDGAILPGWPINVQQALRDQNFKPALQNQRGALALLKHRIFIAYGGHYGDCGDYRGIVLGLDTNPPHMAASWITRASKGGIWAPGGISEADGALFFATGNTETGAEWADGEGVFRLSPELTRTTDPHAFFAPGNWKAMDERDLDMSGVTPLPFDLPGGARRLLALGKDGNAYLLDRDNLGGFNGEIARRLVANSAIITGPAAVQAGGNETVVFQARNALCPEGKFTGGLAALNVSAAAIEPLWCAPLRGRGAPIITTSDGHADPIVWVDGAEGDERLHAFRADTGLPLFTSAETIPGVRHFETLLVANQHLYIAADNRVVAFSWNAWHASRPKSPR
jgi:hypothetical protein